MDIMNKIKSNKLITALLIIGLFYWGVGYLIDYQYEQKIGSYMENAYDVNTPDAMLLQLNNAQHAMINEGLTPDKYGALIFKKADNSMEFQYRHIGSIIERVNAVQIWLDQTYSKNFSSTENLGDVYESKMTNLRNFIMEDVRSDWIAKKAWYIEHYPWFYILQLGSVSVPHKSSGPLSSSSITLLLVAGIVYWFFIREDKKKEDKPNKEEQGKKDAYF